MEWVRYGHRRRNKADAGIRYLYNGILILGPHLCGERSYPKRCGADNKHFYLPACLLYPTYSTRAEVVTRILGQSNIELFLKSERVQISPRVPPDLSDLAERNGRRAEGETDW